LLWQNKSKTYLLVVVIVAFHNNTLIYFITLSTKWIEVGETNETERTSLFLFNVLLRLRLPIFTHFTISLRFLLYHPHENKSNKSRKFREAKTRGGCNKKSIRQTFKFLLGKLEGRN